MIGDFSVVYPLDNVVTMRRIVASGTTGSINQGEPTKQGTAGAVAAMVDGDGTTTQIFTGFAKSGPSTETASVAGEIYVVDPLPGITYRGKAKVAANADTQAEIDALVGKRVVFDLTAAVWTIDTAAADASTNGITIVGGEYQTSTIYFTVKPTASILSA